MALLLVGVIPEGRDLVVEVGHCDAGVDRPRFSDEGDSLRVVRDDVAEEPLGVAVEEGVAVGVEHTELIQHLQIHFHRAVVDVEPPEGVEAVLILGAVRRSVRASHHVRQAVLDQLAKRIEVLLAFHHRQAVMVRKDGAAIEHDTALGRSVVRGDLAHVSIGVAVLAHVRGTFSRRQVREDAPELRVGVHHARLDLGEVAPLAMVRVDVMMAIVRQFSMPLEGQAQLLGELHQLAGAAVDVKQHLHRRALVGVGRAVRRVLLDVRDQAVPEEPLHILEVRLRREVDAAEPRPPGRDLVRFIDVLEDVIVGEQVRLGVRFERRTADALRVLREHEFLHRPTPAMSVRAEVPDIDAGSFGDMSRHEFLLWLAVERASPHVVA